MIVVGTSVLVDYGKRHPEALASLSALNGLLRQAAWTDRASIEQECGALARINEDGRLLLDLPEAGCRVMVGINLELGIVRITSVTELNQVKDDD
ncbi:hypothetical protein [Rhodoligotrophos ferricapiens]|uniref:hypothetical protein n=1 Tax=Rhodoligotrophos ferricapiens TaxID=3069264 RepID=UPI00315C68E2